jgi:predicted transcriptional regulator
MFSTSEKNESETTGVLDYIAKNLAVSLPKMSQYFQIPEDQIKIKLGPLMSEGFIKEQHSGWYTITANGIKQVEQSVKTGLATLL